MYTNAIIEVKIIQNTLDKENTYTDDQATAKDNMQFQFQLYEMALMDDFEVYQTIV